MERRNSIVGLGEVLWDVFPEGPRFGGAPANFACIASQLAAGEADVDMVSRVGRDELGMAAIARLSELGVCADFVDQSFFPTGRVDVTLDSAGMASYRFAEVVAWDQLEWTPALGDLAKQTHVICFGTLAQRTMASRETIQRFVRETPSDAVRVFDINLRTPYWSKEVIRESLALANVLKLNDAELPILTTMLKLEGDDLGKLKQLNQLYSLKLSALTRGASGSLLVSALGEISELPAPPTSVVDTVGAGDAFTAAMMMGMVRKMTLDEIHRWASRVAAYVCSQPGATPMLPAELRST